jgi:hypothetical protein
MVIETLMANLCSLESILNGYACVRPCLISQMLRLYQDLEQVLPT